MSSTGAIASSHPLYTVANAYWHGSDIIDNGAIPPRLSSWTDRLGGYVINADGGTAAGVATSPWRSLGGGSGLNEAFARSSALVDGCKNRGVFSFVMRTYPTTTSNWWGIYPDTTTSRFLTALDATNNRINIQRDTTTLQFSTTIDAAVKYTVGYVYDGTNSIVYKNGALVGSQAATQNINTDATRWGRRTSSPLDGAVKLWIGVALTAAQMAYEHTQLTAEFP